LDARRGRFAVLTDAAIDLLADSGMRGLTHRAVDARAGVPVGSTSACFRTRKALIEAVVKRLADLDQADLERGRLGAGSPLFSGAQPLGSEDLDQLAASIAALLGHWLTHGRRRALARYACLLEATHHPGLREILAYGITIRAQARALLARAGAPNPDRRGDQLVAYIDGLLFDRLVGAGALDAPEPGTTDSQQELEAAVRILLHALARRDD
jgi:AcrR family transcriptional regulator